MELAAGQDFRQPEHRREVFLRFYDFHLRYRAHPGGVYYLLPYLRERLGWDEEEALWFAFLNGNTQHPVTSLALHRRFPTPDHAEAMLAWWREHYARLAFDTDRRYHKKALDVAVAGYLGMVGGPQAPFWRRVAEAGWPAVWQVATSIPTFGRLSAFSYAEYLRIMGIEFDCGTLFLGDRSGSRSHRNGLCIVLGRDELDWHTSNPDFDGTYPAETVEWLGTEAESLVGEAHRRAVGTPWAGDIGYFTLESALCTYKSWHRPNRRYPNVYNDMLYDRLRASEAAWPDEPLDLFWSARAAALPPHLRLEDSPHDPGCVAVKQNHYRETGQVVMMHRDWPCFANDLNDAIDSGTLPLRPER